MKGKTTIRLRRRAAALGALAPLLALGAAGQANAKTYEVTSPDNGGRGSLRAAIKDANRHKGADKVVVSKKLRRDIKLDSDLKISATTKILGRGRDRKPHVVATGFGNRAADIKFYVEKKLKDPTLSIRGLTLEGVSIYAYDDLSVKFTDLIVPRDNGKPGDGILIDESDLTVSNAAIRGWGRGIVAYDGARVTVSDAELTDNAAGALIDESVATFTTSRMADNGLGLELDRGRAELSGSLVQGNAPWGGVSAHDGSSIDVKRSTVAGNRAPRGGGLAVTNGSTGLVLNSTVSGNIAEGNEQVPAQGGGIFAANGREVEIDASTVTANVADEGGAIFLGKELGGDDPVTVESSIVAANTTAAGEECMSIEQAGPPPQPISEGGNVFGTTGCGTTDPSDQLVGDPLLGPLADNGGETPTHALQPGSPAIGNGKDVGLAADQRGTARDGDPDSGSFELVP